MKFRDDINGLRTIAVIAVVLFHFNESWLPGGFAGVDVFFVISGFLMTGIIFKGIENRNLSLRKFYKARAKRIIPALSAVCLFVLIYGFFNLYDTEFKDSLNQVVSALSFWSNFYFWETSSYFSAGSETKILLHTWSLSAEWQFYIIYPFVIFIFSRFLTINGLKVIVAVGCVLSFIISIYATPQWPTNAYYLLPTRAWEMLLGGIAYFIRLKLKINYLKVFSTVGLLLIFGSYFFISKHDIWPGYLALIPTLGTFIIIISNAPLRIFKYKFIQAIGVYSYSIYLWHWVAVYFLYRYSDQSTFILLLAMGLSILLGYLSYELIEKKGSGLSNKLIMSSALCLSVIFYSLFDDIIKVRSISNTENNELITLYQKTKISSGPWIDNLCTENKPCVQGGLFLWGDSHAHALYNGFKKANTTNLSVITTKRCEPSLSYPDYTLKYRVICNKNNKKALEQIALKRPEVVVLAQRYKHENTDWELISSKLKQLGVNKVFVFGPVPQFKGELPLLVAKKYINGFLIEKRDMDESIFTTNEKMIEKIKIDFEYLDVLNQLCDKNGCVFQSIKGDNHKLISSDYGHLNNTGSIFIVNQFIKRIL
ncbi:MAG: peptidoglycan/LPS O-acetylase OafA/YrhL [Psychroserpens sp.]|jgi:peptidoglycan/LPS O-acetylase OafA/YrhL